MVAMTQDRVCIGADEVQLVTFFCGDVLLGLRIEQVQEINRQTTVTPVPEASDFVSGAINLRGELATVIDLNKVLGLARPSITKKTRNVMVTQEKELIGLLVDSVSDIITVPVTDLVESPANVIGIDARFFQKVYVTPDNIVVLLELDEVIQQNE